MVTPRKLVEIYFTGTPELRRLRNGKPWSPRHVRAPIFVDIASVLAGDLASGPWALCSEDRSRLSDVRGKFPRSPLIWRWPFLPRWKWLNYRELVPTVEGGSMGPNIYLAVNHAGLRS